MDINELKTFNAEIKLGKWRCCVEIARYVWMRPEQNPQVDVHIWAPTVVRTNGAFQALTLPGLLAATATAEQVRDALQAWADLKGNQSSLIPCIECGGPAWNRRKFPSPYRDRRCEDCWMEEWRARSAQIEANRQTVEDRRDDKKRIAGFTHKTVAWVHPIAGGSDYALLMYTKGECPVEFIQNQLKLRRSSVLTDFIQKAI